MILHIMAINKNYQWDRKDYNNVSSKLSVSVSCSQHLERKGGIVMALLRAASKMTKWPRYVFLIQVFIWLC